MTPKQRRASVSRRLHRKIGAFLAVFVVFLVVTGLAINHANSLGLDRHTVKQSLLLKWYGLEGPENIQSFKLTSQWVSFAGSQLFLDDQPISSLSEPVGAVSNGSIIVAAGKHELVLLDHNGQLIERQAWSATNASAIESIGLLPDAGIVLKSDRRLWVPDADFIQWDVINDVREQPLWSAPMTAPESLLQTISNVYQGDGLSLERLILDLHSGRFFGTAGVLIYDALALLLGFLAISGLLLWSRGRNGKNGRFRKRKKHDSRR